MIRQSWLLALLTLFLALPAQAAFVDNTDGTVTDTVTGLMWDKCSWGQSNTDCTGGAAATSDWKGALGVAVIANAMNSGAGYKGHTDWRLPNVNELESLVDLTHLNPTIDPVFQNAPAQWYWSSTNYAPDPREVWYVNFYDGSPGYDWLLAHYHYVRLVRGGQPIDSFDAQDATPDAFSFTDQTGVALSAAITSAPVQITGINTAASWSATNGTACVSATSDCSSCSFAASGTVSNNQYLCARHTSSAAYSTAVDTVVTVGGVSDTFSSTTLGTPVNGACVTGQTLTTAPTDPNLCTTGTASAVVSGTTSYTWSCLGSNGGSDDTTCSAVRNYLVTTSVSGGNGTISASQTVAYHATPSFTLTPNPGYLSGPVSGTCGGTLSGNSYTVTAVTASCTVVGGFRAALPPPPPVPAVSCLDLSGMPTGFSVIPCILNMGSGDGPGIVIGLTGTLANTLALASFGYQNQSASGTVVMQYDGGKLAFLPLSVQTGDPRPNGIYPVGNGKYVVVTNGTAVTVAPGIINLAELAPLLPGWTVQVDGQGIVSATNNGTTYIVQPDYLVQLAASGSPSLWMDADGRPHFTDSAGNSQTLYPAFLESSSLWDYLLMLDGGATLNIQLDGTALVRLFGQNYVLVPDLTLGAVPADHGTEYWWQEGERRYQMRNRGHFGTTQGFGVRQAAMARASSVPPPRLRARPRS